MTPDTTPTGPQSFAALIRRLSATTRDLHALRARPFSGLDKEHRDEIGAVELVLRGAEQRLLAIQASLAAQRKPSARRERGEDIKIEQEQETDPTRQDLGLKGRESRSQDP